MMVVDAQREAEVLGDARFEGITKYSPVITGFREDDLFNFIPQELRVTHMSMAISLKQPEISLLCQRSRHM